MKQNTQSFEQDIKPILESISNIVKEHVSGDYQLFLFGSRARGGYEPKADIDIGINSKQKLTPVQLQAIKARIEAIPTLLKIDFVDFAAVADDCKGVALKHKKKI